jgi:hypothetical protein
MFYGDLSEMFYGFVGKVLRMWGGFIGNVLHLMFLENVLRDFSKSQKLVGPLKV